MARPIKSLIPTLLLALCVALCCPPALAAQKNAVTYLREGDSGVLMLEGPATGVQRFSIQTIGASCYTCEVSGTLRRQIGQPDDAVGNDTCRETSETRGPKLGVRN